MSSIQINVTPIGSSSGLYIAEMKSNGFVIKENSSGKSSISFNWFAIGVKSGYENPELATEVLPKVYDENKDTYIEKYH